MSLRTQAERLATFRALHTDRAPGDPLVLPGPWDAASARAFTTAGHPALATPSAGIAASLGYEDGSTPADEMFEAVARICSAVEVPVSADIENGYGLPADELVERLLDAGAVGCNLEDTHGGALRNTAEQAAWLGEFVTAAAGRIFLNARTDSYLRGSGEEAEATERIRAYRAAGADCVFPVFAAHEHLPELRRSAAGPLSILARPEEDRRTLGELGATRITFGPFLQHAAAASYEKIGRSVLPQG